MAQPDAECKKQDNKILKFGNQALVIFTILKFHSWTSTLFWLSCVSTENHEIVNDIQTLLLAVEFFCQIAYHTQHIFFVCVRSKRQLHLSILLRYSGDAQFISHHVNTLVTVSKDFKQYYIPSFPSYFTQPSLLVARKITFRKKYYTQLRSRSQ